MTRILLLLAAALAVVGAACGGGDDALASSGVASVADAASDPVASLDASVPASEEASVEATDEEQVLAFAQCLRDEGLEVQDPTVAADGTVNIRDLFQGQAEGQGPPEGFRAAFDVCGDLIDGLQRAPGGDVDQSELQDSLLEFAQCVRDNGYDMPDPDFSAGPGRPFGDIDQSDPTFVAAQEACSDILDGFGAAGPGGGSRCRQLTDVLLKRSRKDLG